MIVIETLDNYTYSLDTDTGQLEIIYNNDVVLITDIESARSMIDTLADIYKHILQKDN